MRLSRHEDGQRFAGLQYRRAIGSQYFEKILRVDRLGEDSEVVAAPPILLNDRPGGGGAAEDDDAAFGKEGKNFSGGLAAFHFAIVDETGQKDVRLKLMCGGDCISMPVDGAGIIAALVEDRA